MGFSLLCSPLLCFMRREIFGKKFLVIHVAHSHTTLSRERKRNYVLSPYISPSKYAMKLFGLNWVTFSYINHSWGLDKCLGLIGLGLDYCVNHCSKRSRSYPYTSSSDLESETKIRVLLGREKVRIKCREGNK